MTEDLGTTPRKVLTPRQRLALFEAFKGICPLCEQRIQVGEKWIDEHMRALGLAGSNDWDNRAPVHEHCAKLKTKDDMARINKAKRQKMHHLGIKPESRRKLPGSKDSPIKIKLDGTRVWRATGLPVRREK